MKPFTPDMNSLLPKLRNNCSWFFAVGITLLILGFLALSYQFLATVFSIYFIGTLLFIAGIVQALHSFKLKGVGQTALWAVMGVLYIIAGILSFTQPVAVSAAFTLIISFLLIVSGITQIINALHNRGFPKWGWWLFSGVITLILGFMIIMGWPTNSLWVLGMFVGIDLMFQGWAYIAVGLAIKSAKQ
ncbi:HdeD family acid-resistance protein [Orbus sturtevantii]|uniref:HdeD family acid-resistance protein n=1 Tax=Orbus sturtevantii TaxID=3074109 RepID=UPI00370DA214